MANKKSIEQAKQLKIIVKTNFFAVKFFYHNLLQKQIVLAITIAV